MPRQYLNFRKRNWILKIRLNILNIVQRQFTFTAKHGLKHEQKLSDKTKTFDLNNGRSVRVSWNSQHKQATVGETDICNL